MDVKRIVIKGESGFWQSFDPFKEKIVITSNSISYEWWKLRPRTLPLAVISDDSRNVNAKEIQRKGIEWENHKKWSYRSENTEFYAKFKMISEELEKIIEDGERFFCLDANMFEFILIGEDGTKTSMSTCSVAEYISNVFTLIEQLIPDLEMSSYRESSVFSLHPDEEHDDNEDAED